MTGPRGATVLVLMGGPDAEREVSLVSGRAVAAALREAGYAAIERTIDRITAQELRGEVERDGVAVVFPALHGHWGEGGALQEELELLDVPYVGARPSAAALCMNKLAAKSLVAGLGVPTPPARALDPGEPCEIEPPLVLKPIDDGSSVDLRICRTRDQVAAARRELHPKRGRLLAERYIAGRELTVGIVCGEVLPLIEIVPAVEFYDYAAKYERDDTLYRLEPDLPPGVAERCREDSLRAYRRLGCRDLARVDFMLDERGPWFLEVNTMPGFTPHSLVPMAARRVGVEMPGLCARLVEAALERGGARAKGRRPPVMGRKHSGR